MSAPWTLRHAVDIGGQPVRVRLTVDDTRGVGRLLWQLVALGGAVDVTPAQVAHGCRACPAPEPAHCPGCGSCSPGYRCSLLCDADPADVDRAVAELAVWDSAQREVLAVRRGDSRTQQEKQHDKIGPGSGDGRQQDAQKQGAAGAPKR